jgi:hypothetical protein
LHDAVRDLTRRFLAVDAHAVVVDDHCRAFRSSRDRDRAADAASGTRDRDDLAFERTHWIPPLSWTGRR